MAKRIHVAGLTSSSRMAPHLRRLVDALIPYGPDRIYLFGSWATGEADELSDVDLVVIKRTPAPFFDRLREVARLLPTPSPPVDILVYTPEEFARMRADGNAFAEMIEAEGVILYDAGPT